jgi:hypothetical protein
MFFRNAKPHEPTFDERISGLSQFGFVTSRESGGCKVTRKSCGAVVEQSAGGKLSIGKPGLIVGKEIAELVNGGFQMFFRTPSGKEVPALASQLKELHAFDEDLREGLGLTSLYNESLGTTSPAHLYDRVRDRDQPHPARPWEK